MHKFPNLISKSQNPLTIRKLTVKNAEIKLAILQYYVIHKVSVPFDRARKSQTQIVNLVGEFL